jgi:quinolinate synthase
MAESAKILNPGKTVYLPAPDAGCPMADMIKPQDVIALRRRYPDAAVMCYVNSSAAVKAVSDVCCTSSSALRISRKIEEKQIIFVPDQNLAAYVQSQLPEKQIIPFSGFCPTHHRVTEADALAAKRAHPSAAVLVHPECRPEVLKHADFIGSTAGILEAARKNPADEFIIGTEEGVAEILAREFPGKRFYLLKAGFTCPNMKKTSLDDVIRALEGGEPPIVLPEAELAGAAQSLKRMVSM